MKKKRPIRVTEVLDFVNSKWKEYWYRHVGFEKADRISKESREFGTKVHKIIEDHLNGCLQIEDYSELELEVADLIIKWLEENNVKTLHTELELENPKLNLVGHADFIGELGSEAVVIDWKTSKEHRTEFPLQKAAYAKMANDKLGLKINKGITLRCDRENRVLDVKEYKKLVTTYWPQFLCCLKVFKIFNGK